MVHKDIDYRRAVGDIPGRLVAIARLDEALAAEGVEAFNTNERFVEATQQVLAQLARRGDQVHRSQGFIDFHTR